jgi:hypothetical protein
VKSLGSLESFVVWVNFLLISVRLDYFL